MRRNVKYGGAVRRRFKFFAKTGGGQNLPPPVRVLKKGLHTSCMEPHQWIRRRRERGRYRRLLPAEWRNTSGGAVRLLHHRDGGLLDDGGDPDPGDGPAARRAVSYYG